MAYFAHQARHRHTQSILEAKRLLGLFRRNRTGNAFILIEVGNQQGKGWAGTNPLKGGLVPAHST